MLGANLIIEGAVVGSSSHEPVSQGIYVVLLIEEVVQFITENKKKKQTFYILPHVCLCLTWTSVPDRSNASSPTPEPRSLETPPPKFF
jgi:hypothetical protein